MVEFGENEKTVDMTLKAFDDENENIAGKAFESAAIFKTNKKIQNKLLSILDDKGKYSVNIVNRATFMLAKQKNEKAIKELYNRLNTTTDVEEFKIIALNIQEIINDPSVFDIILNNYNRLKIKGNDFYFIDTPLLLEYIKTVTDEHLKQTINILHSKIYNLAAYIPGDIPYYDSAVEILCSKLDHANPDVRREIMFTLADIAAQSVRDKMLQDSKVYDSILTILNNYAEKELDPQIKDLTRQKVEYLKGLKCVKPSDRETR